jgi:hypothetical protein
MGLEPSDIQGIIRSSAKPVVLMIYSDAGFQKSFEEWAVPRKAAGVMKQCVFILLDIENSQGLPGEPYEQNNVVLVFRNGQIFFRANGGEVFEKLDSCIEPLLSGLKS